MHLSHICVLWLVCGGLADSSMRACLHLAQILQLCFIKLFCVVRVEVAVAPCQACDFCTTTSHGWLSYFLAYFLLIFLIESREPRARAADSESLMGTVSFTPMCTPSPGDTWLLPPWLLLPPPPLPARGGVS